MALYQPSFCVPRNQAIDATDSNDMIFSFKLNGNNPLVAYNIRIYDNDSNKLVYELVSTDSERAIKEEINIIRSWIEWQEDKQTQLDESKQAYEASNIKIEFRNNLRTIVDSDKSKLLDMEATLNDKKANKKLGQTDITKYFEYWGMIVSDLGRCIGDEDNPQQKTGEFILAQLNNWMNIDPNRKDGIEYKDKNIIVVNEEEFKKVKTKYLDFKKYYSEVMDARKQLGASDLTYINDKTLEYARNTLYLIYSEFSNEAFFGKDLYESINSAWLKADFNKLAESIDDVYDEWVKEIGQQEYALAHLSGGYTNKTTNVYNSATASNTNVQQILQKDTAVAIIADAPAGWYRISRNGTIGFVQSSDITIYNIAHGKYYLEQPVYPTNYEGEQNTVYQQIPLSIINEDGKEVSTLKNGKSYKWSVTLYWSTSGKYNQDDEIDGSLTSVENYFDTRKKPVVGIENYKQIFSIPSNYVTAKNSFVIYGEDGENLQVKVGDNVRIIKLDTNDPNIAEIEFTQEKTNKTLKGITNISNLNGLGLYGKSTDYILPMKKAMFVGSYEQEQYTSIAYFRWVLYKLQNDTEEIAEVVKDTGMVPSADFQFFYDGFLNDEKYAIQAFVQTLDNVEAQTDLIKFKASYITYSIQNMMNAENSPIEHGIIVEWSNLRLIQGEVHGGHHYERNMPTQDKTSLTLDKGTDLVFERDKGKPLAVDFDTNQILCTRFDEDRPTTSQVYYTASGLDDNGDVVSKTLEMIPTKDTQSTGKVILRYTVKTPRKTEKYDQEIIASPLYWYVIIMTSTGFKVFTRYAKGLFPALDQYPNRNKFTGENGLYPDALTYFEEPSEEVQYNYQTIIDKNGNRK